MIARIHSVVAGLLGPAAAGDLRSRVARGAAGTLAVRIAAMAVSLVCTMLLTRLLGDGGYGAFINAVSWLGLLSIPAVLGCDRLLVREVAANAARGSWGALRGVMRWSNIAVITAALAVALLAALVVGLLLAAGRWDREMLLTLLVALVALPFSALSALRQSALRGLHHVVMASMPDQLIPPLLLAGMLGVAWVAARGALTAPTVVAMNVVSIALAFGVGALLLHWKLPAQARTAVAEYHGRVWRAAALPMMLIGGMYVTSNRADTILLGLLTDKQSVGLYGVAARCAEFVVFGLVALNTVLAPVFAQLYATRDVARLQRVLTVGARVATGLCLPVALALIFAGKWILPLLFGPEFASAAPALALLATAQLVNAACGSQGMLLMMTGYERDAAVGMGISAFLNVVLNCIFIPLWGVLGAALATAFTTVAWNIVLLGFVRRRLRLHTTVFGALI